MSPRTSEGVTRVGRGRCALRWLVSHCRDNPLSQATPSCGQPYGGRYSSMPTRPSRNSPSRRSRRGMHRRRVTGVPGRALARRNSSTNCPISHSPRPQGRVRGSGAGCGAAPVTDRRLDPAALHPDGHLDRLEVAGPIREALVVAVADGQNQVVDNIALDGGRQLLQAGSDDTPKAGKAGRRGGKADVLLLSAAGVAAVMAWWGVLQARVVQLGHRAGVGAAWRQPSRAPRQRLPAVTVVTRSLPGRAAVHRSLGPPQPVQLRCQRPGAVLKVVQVAVAVERLPVDAAGPAAPVAGLRGARTGVVGLGPAAAAVALVDPRAGREANLPGPTRCPAGHQTSPPLACCQAPTTSASRRARPRRSRIARPPYAPAVGPAGHGLDAASDPKRRRPAASSATVPCSDIRSTSGRAPMRAR
jgi:hypothetical protein